MCLRSRVITMTNSVTNQTWKLWLTSGCLTPVNHLSCISHGAQLLFPPSHFDIWLCSCVKPCVLAPCIAAVMSRVSSAPVFWTCSRTCSAHSHVFRSGLAQHHMSLSTSASLISTSFLVSFSEWFPDNLFSHFNQYYSIIIASMTHVIFFFSPLFC